MTISACMMVKNEEHNLRRCLNSIKELCDEIIILDTGSIDKTVEIAKEFTDKIFFEEWENDFSKHRNTSLSYATGDWVLIIDADEEMKFQPDYSIEQIKKDFNDAPKDLIAMQILFRDVQKGKFAMQSETIRFFRNGSVQYKGIVHNKPVFEGKCGLHSAICLDHYGYDLDEEGKRKKRKRTINLL